MTNNAPVIQQRLQLYQNDQPFRQSFTNASTLRSATEDGPANELPKN
jgi:hypothetical protein